jgi:hypothetical protein
MSASQKASQAISRLNVKSGVKAGTTIIIIIGVGGGGGGGGCRTCGMVSAT